MFYNKKKIQTYFQKLFFWACDSFCSWCLYIRPKGKMMKGPRGFYLYNWCYSGEMLPQDTLAPVCEGADDLMKMSRFSCHIIWHLLSAPTVWDNRVGGPCVASGSVWLTVGSWERDGSRELPQSYAFYKSQTSQSIWVNSRKHWDQRDKPPQSMLSLRLIINHTRIL